MPLRGKIVVIKRSGVDGTEFPLTATCLFGRKSDCDIRIQLPQVSKEHCRIDLNENKEVILTNLSSVNPTRVNGEVLQQSERLKHGDVITVIDRSFRFEYPPTPTPKKRSSKGGNLETLKVLRDQQVGGKEEKRVSEVSTDPLKDETNNNNVPPSLEKTVAVESQDGSSSRQSKSAPFSDLYQMIKQSMEVKTPGRCSLSLLQTPSSKLCTPKPASVMKSDVKGGGTPQSAMRRKSSQIPPAEPLEREAASPRRRSSGAPEKFTASEVVEMITQTPKSPVRRRSKEATPTKPETKEQAKQLQTASPKSSTGKEGSKKRKSAELSAQLTAQQLKRKRVSFGGQLSPELFDKRLPPDSPLRRGAAPRRSLSLLRPKQSLLRRASVIGMLKEFDSPGKSKKSSASPKTPTPEKKVQKSKSSSPRAASPATKSPKSASSSPKGPTPAKKSPQSASSAPKAASPAKKSPKAATPAKKSPKSASSPKAATPAKKSSSPKAATPKSPSPASRTPARTPANSGVSTPAIQGRFSVSRISTPSPVAEVDEQVSSVTATPMLRLKRKSMKSAAKKTPSVSKSAVKMLVRRSGISRASMKVSNWADIVRFGKPKAQAVAPSQTKVTQKTIKKTLSNPLPKTPVKKLKDHVSTGHADSPVTIVVGRAHKQTVAPPTGAAPKVITNVALLKKNMKMDEDLSGISDMFKTPANKKRRFVSNAETPAGSQAASAIEPSVLNTPEETGEMMVSPLSVASAVKAQGYNSEAVQRLFNGDKESSFVCEAPALEIPSEADADAKTPKQKPEAPECLTGVKRIMKSPRLKAEPVEDLRGKLLKTPKQKVEQQECLSGVKRIMKTPKQKAEPVDDIRGNLLRTPKQPSQQEECLSAVKRVFQTPQPEAEPLEIPTTTQTAEAIQEIQETPAVVQVSQDLSVTPNAKIPAEQRLMGIKRMMPKEKSAPVEDMVGLKRIMKSPKEKGQPVEDNFGIKRLVRSPRLRGNAPVDDFQGLKELMEEQQETNEDKLSDAANVSKLNATKTVEAVEEQTVTEAAAEDDMLLQQPANDKVEEDLQVQVETAASQSEEVDSAITEPAQEKKASRGRKAKPVESKAAEESVEVPEATSPVAPVRGRRGRKTEAPATPAAQQTRRRNAKAAEDVEFVVEKAPEVALKPKRGRSARKVSEVPPETAMETDGDQAELAADDGAAKPEKVAPKKRGRKPKLAEPPVPEQEDVTEEAEPSTDASTNLEASQSESDSGKSAEADEAAEETEAGAAEKKSVRGRRGKRAEAEEQQETAAKEPVRGRRGRKAEAAVPPAAKITKRCRNAKTQDQPTDETPEQAELQTEESPEEKASTKEEAAVKPQRGRRAKQTPAEAPQPEPEPNNASADEQVTEAEPEQSVPPPAAAVKPRRGRKPKAEVTEHPEEDLTVATETSQQPPVRSRRGRNAKAEEEKVVDAAEAAESQEPPKKARRTRKLEQKPEEAAEEVLSVETVVSQEAEDEAAAAMAAKPRRGAKAKQEAQSVSAEVQEVPTEKPKRGRRPKQAVEEQDASSETPQETGNAEPEAEVAKPSKTRGARSSAKREPPAANPAKRGRRGTADEVASNGNPSEDSIGESKTSKKSIKWKPELEVYEIPKVTPLKAGRGRRSKVAEEKVPKEVEGTEEEDLSGKAAGAPPIKRARRGAKAVDAPAEKEETTEAPPKPRRGRPAKK
ncbi:unnamed protein product [Ophioblennius macclurei]